MIFNLQFAIPTLQFASDSPTDDALHRINPGSALRTVLGAEPFLLFDYFSLSMPRAALLGFRRFA
jgi:hypothetical protein